MKRQIIALVMLGFCVHANAITVGDPNATIEGLLLLKRNIVQFQFQDLNVPANIACFQFANNQFKYRFYKGATATYVNPDPLLIDENYNATFGGDMTLKTTTPTITLRDPDVTGWIPFITAESGVFKYKVWNTTNWSSPTYLSIDTAGNSQFVGNIVTTAGKIGIGTASPTTALHVVGETTTNVINITGGSDLAEQFQVSNDVKPGTVVCIDAEHPGQLKASTKAYDKTVAGVISGAGGLQTGMKMGQQGSIADGSHPVALSGRVYCNVDATKGAVRPGDLLTTSNTPGCAMVVKDHAKAQGAVIGKAMTSLKAGQKGLVLVLISLQ